MTRGMRSFLPRRKTYIAELEMWAVLVAVGLWKERWKGGRVRAFVDNNTTLGVLIKGASKKLTLALGSEVLWEDLWKGDLAQWWLGRVASKDNPADGPSRGQGWRGDEQGLRPEEEDPIVVRRAIRRVGHRWRAKARHALAKGDLD